MKLGKVELGDCAIRERKSTDCYHVRQFRIYLQVKILPENGRQKARDWAWTLSDYLGRKVNPTKSSLP